MRLACWVFAAFTANSTSNRYFDCILTPSEYVNFLGHTRFSKVWLWIWGVSSTVSSIPWAQISLANPTFYSFV